VAFVNLPLRAAMARLDQGSTLALVFLVLFCSASVVSSQCSTQGVDKTLEDGATGEDVVKATADKIRESGIFGDDHEFLRRMAKVESDDGTSIVQGMGGIWRIEMETTFMKVEEHLQQTPCENQQQNTCLQDQFEEEFCFNWSMDVRTKGYRAMDVPLYSALYVMVYLVKVQQVTTIPEDIESQANIWVVNFNRARDQQEFVDVATDLQGEQCNIKGVDMVFVMDESGSIGASNFEKMKQLAIDITDSFEIGPDRTRVAWISFASSARVVFHLNDYSTKETLQNEIRGIVYRSGGTAIGEGLETLRTEGFIGGRDNFDTPEVAIVVTDGLSNAGIDTSIAAANLHRERNVNLFAVGVGAGVNTTELAIIASAGIENTQDHTQHIDGFIDKQLNTLQQLIRARTCFDAMFSDHDQSIERLNAANVSIPQGVTVHVAVECPLEGLTVNACGRTGKTILYFSRSSSPNSANYEIILTILAGRCSNTYIDCVPMSSGRRRRQAAGSRIFMTVEGIAETNEYDLTAMTGDFSTPQVNLQCSKRVDDDRQSVIVSCRHDRELVDARCSINNAPPQQCTLPWKVAFTPPTKVYDLQISVTDTLQLNDTAQLEHTVGPLVLDCSLNQQMEIECLSSNQLDLNQTVCSFRGNTMDHCILPYKIDVKGWPLGTHEIHVSATDVFGSLAEAAFEYIVVADRVGDDMVFSTVLDISPIEVGVNDKTVSLCYQVHGEEEKFYNLVSDDCLSVNAHVTQPVPGVKSHVIDKIGIRAIGNNATYCYDIGIARENCSVTVNGNPISVNEKFTEEGIEVFNDRMIARNPNVIRISVPNCGRALVDAIQITCTEYNMRISRTETVPVKVLELTTTRGISPIEAAHGLVGQFWGRFMLGRSQSPLPSPRQRYDKAVMIFHDTTLQRFDGFVRRSWSHSREMCFYAGDRQGYPVLQGEYGDYELETMFGTEYRFSRFKQDMCMSEDGSSM
jgi:uncharacterized protein YegL